MVLGKLPVPGRPTSLDKSRARACCSCNRCGWGLFGHFYSHLSFLSSLSGVVGRCDGAGLTSSSGASYTLDYSRARAYCTCSRCGWGLYGHFYSHLSFLSSFSLSLGDGPILTEILSQRAVKPKTTNQPTNSSLFLSLGDDPI